MPSPKPRPVSLKLLEGRGNGRDSGGRKVAEVPNFKRDVPIAPGWLPPEARAEWDRVVPELSRLDILKASDRAALVAYCLCWDRLVAAQEIVSREGVLGENSQGRVRNPAVAVVEAASKELRSWAAEFGFTPSSESRVSREGTGDEDDIFSG